MTPTGDDEQESADQAASEADAGLIRGSNPSGTTEHKLNRSLHHFQGSDPLATPNTPDSNLNAFSRRRSAELLAVLVLVGSWALIFSPAILFSQLFTLDVGGIFAKAADYPHNIAWAFSPDSLGGRYFPIYWLYNFVLYRLFGLYLAAHFAFQILLFAASIGLLCHLLWRFSNSLWLMAAFGVAVATGGTTAENLYTLGKAEPLASAILVAIIGLSRSWLLGEHAAASRFAPIAVLFLLAMWTKETSLALLAFAPGIVFAELYIARKRWREALRYAPSRQALFLLLAVVSGAVLARAIRSGVGVLSSVGKDANSVINYVDYRIDASLLLGNLEYYAAQHPDVVIFGFVGSACCIFALMALRRDPSVRTCRGVAQHLPFVFGLTLTGWAYVCGLLIWRWPMGYYLLLPSLLFKFSALYGMWLVARLTTAPVGLVTSFTTLIALAFVHSVFHGYYVASSQIAYSRMYTEALLAYARRSTNEERLVMESFPFYAEQVANTGQLLIQMGSPRPVAGIAEFLDPAVATPAILKLLRITQGALDANEASLPRKGDFVLVMTGNKLAHWAVRGAVPLYREDSILRKERYYDMELLAENRIFNWAAYYDIWTERLSSGPSYIGYKLYQVAGNEPRLLWRGRYPDGWIGGRSSLELFLGSGEGAMLTASTPEFNSPNRLKVFRGEALIEQLELHAGRQYSVPLRTPESSRSTRFHFEVEKTASPKAQGLNKDDRSLGVLLSIEPLR